MTRWRVGHHQVADLGAMRVIMSPWRIRQEAIPVQWTIIILGTRRNAFHLTDAWGEGPPGLHMLDSVVLWPGEA